jgi:hypothetical protein
MARRKITPKRYHGRVHKDRERIAREERKARGEPNENERFAADLVDRIRRGGSA